MWLGHEGRNLVNEISAFTTMIPESSFTPSTTWGYRERTATMNQDPGPHHNSESAGVFILDFPAFRLWETNFCCLYKQQVYDILLL